MFSEQSHAFLKDFLVALTQEFGREEAVVLDLRPVLAADTSGTVERIFSEFIFVGEFLDAAACLERSDHLVKDAVPACFCHRVWLPRCGSKVPLRGGETFEHVAGDAVLVLL